MFVIYDGILGSLKGVFFLLVTGIFFQAYPVMLQRYLRPRYAALWLAWKQRRMTCGHEDASISLSISGVGCHSPFGCLVV